MRLILLLALCLSSCEAAPALAAETWTATAYCACVKCCGKSDGITASGKKAKPGKTVAVNWLPFGTRLRINDHTYVVQDRGAKSHFGSPSLKKKRVDVFFATHQEALQFGKRKVEVEIL